MADALTRSPTSQWLRSRRPRARRLGLAGATALSAFEDVLVGFGLPSRQSNGTSSSRPGRGVCFWDPTALRVPQLVASNKP